nr:hypothetical protein [Candidatus Sigynarchaeota archaeon]
MPVDYGGIFTNARAITHSSRKIERAAPANLVKPGTFSRQIEFLLAKKPDFAKINKHELNITLHSEDFTRRSYPLCMEWDTRPRLSNVTRR